MDVAGDGDRAAFVDGIDEAVERFGGNLPGREHPNIVNDNKVYGTDPGDGASN